MPAESWQTEPSTHWHMDISYHRKELAQGCTRQFEKWLTGSQSFTGGSVVVAPIMVMIFKGIACLAIILAGIVVYVWLLQAQKDKALAHEAEQRRRSRHAVAEWRRMDPHDFEHEVADIFRKQGFKADVSPVGPDKGIDIRLEKDGLHYKS